MSTDDKILAYAQARLSTEDRVAFENEISQDPDLRAEIVALTAVREVLSKDSKDMPGDGWQRLSDKIDGQTPRVANENRPIRLSLLQAASVAVASVIGWQVFDATVLPSDPAPYVTASVGEAGPSVQVVFADRVDFSDVTELLMELDGTIIDGPSALGIYTVAFPDTALREAAFSVLGERSDIAAEVLKN